MQNLYEQKSWSLHTVFNFSLFFMQNIVSSSTQKCVLAWKKNKSVMLLLKRSKLQSVLVVWWHSNVKLLRFQLSSGTRVPMVLKCVSQRLFLGASRVHQEGQAVRDENTWLVIRIFLWPWTLTDFGGDGGETTSLTIFLSLSKLFFCLTRRQFFIYLSSADSIVIFAWKWLPKSNVAHE